jgi:hypothetical protein
MADPRGSPGLRPGEGSRASLGCPSDVLTWGGGVSWRSMERDVSAVRAALVAALAR